MNFGYSLRHFQNNPELTTGLKIAPKNYQSFFANGYKLGMKYLGSKNIMTQKFNKLIKGNTVQKFPDIVTTEEDLEDSVKITKKIKMENNFKKMNFQELSSNQSYIENSDQELNESKSRSFRIITKGRSYGEKQKSNGYGEVSSKYVNQIKELEGTLSEIKNMREFYEREKRALEEQNQMRIRTMGSNDFIYSGMNYYNQNNNRNNLNFVNTNNMNNANYGLNANLGSNPTIIGNNLSNPWMNNNFIMPNTFNNNQPIYMPNFKQTANNSPNHQEKIEKSNRKQSDLEEQFLKLKQENEQILKDKEKKQNEISELKQMIEEIKKPTPISNEDWIKKVSSKKIIFNLQKNPNEQTDQKSQNEQINNKTQNDNLKTQNVQIKAQNEENKNQTTQNISPSNINIDKLLEGKKIEEKHDAESKYMESPQLIAKLNQINGVYANKHDRNFKLPLENLEQDLKNEQKFMGIDPESSKNNTKPSRNEQLIKDLQIKKVKSITILNNNPRNSKDSKAPSPQGNQAINNNQNLHLKEKSPPTNSLVSEQKIPTKNLSSRKSLKNTKIHSMDFLSDSNNPGFILKTLLPEFPRNFPIKKQIYVKGVAFLIECNIVDEGDQAFFLLEGENEDSNIALSEEKLPIQLFSKILQTVDVRDVLPYEIPLKTIDKYEDFMRYCVMPFLGVNIFYYFGFYNGFFRSEAQGIKKLSRFGLRHMDFLSI